jgi:hypothetical protein
MCVVYRYTHYIRALARSAEDALTAAAEARGATSVGASQPPELNMN